jgi:DNA-binding SARP family transcriptional activator
LSQALFSLRRTLQDDPDDPLIVTTRDTVRFNPQSRVWCDVGIFRTLLGISPEQAVAHYGGDFLEGSGVGGSSEFEEWAIVTREQLREQACTALRQLTERDCWADAGKACSYARRWVELDPLCEEAHRRTMALLARVGQRAGALVQFERCRELLHAELGIAPEPETIALYEELKQSAAQPRPRSTQSPGAALPLPPTRLVGREPELAELGALLSETGNRLITLAGPGGVGKTRLALHAALAAASLFSDGV